MLTMIEFILIILLVIGACEKMGKEMKESHGLSVEQ